MRSYDQHILDHYKSVAVEDQLSELSTMKDARTRALETQFIKQFFQEAIRKFLSENRKLEDIIVADVGCGNGYTLSILKNLEPQAKYYGLEYTPELRGLAANRFKQDDSVKVLNVDIRDIATFGDLKVDILICQRVLINLLEPADQKLALQNICRVIKKGGCVLFIEAFQSGLEQLNQARAEFSLEAIPPAHHNLYLKDDFFENSNLKEFKSSLPKNFLSTHYYISRVLHPVVLGSRPFIRNSHFVNFFSNEMDKPVGDFSPLRAYLFSV